MAATTVKGALRSLPSEAQVRPTHRPAPFPPRRVKKREGHAGPLTLGQICPSLSPGHFGQLAAWRPGPRREPPHPLCTWRRGRTVFRGARRSCGAHPRLRPPRTGRPLGLPRCGAGGRRGPSGPCQPATASPRHVPVGGDDSAMVPPGQRSYQESCFPVAPPQSNGPRPSASPVCACWSGGAGQVRRACDPGGLLPLPPAWPARRAQADWQAKRRVCSLQDTRTPVLHPLGPLAQPRHCAQPGPRSAPLPRLLSRLRCFVRRASCFCRWTPCRPPVAFALPLCGKVPPSGITPNVRHPGRRAARPIQGEVFRPVTTYPYAGVP
jgi:hypothetical protein